MFECPPRLLVSPCGLTICPAQNALSDRNRPCQFRFTAKACGGSSHGHHDRAQRPAPAISNSTQGPERCSCGAFGLFRPGRAYERLPAVVRDLGANNFDRPVTRSHGLELFYYEAITDKAG